MDNTRRCIVHGEIGRGPAPPRRADSDTHKIEKNQSHDCRRPAPPAMLADLDCISRIPLQIHSSRRRTADMPLTKHAYNVTQTPQSSYLLNTHATVNCPRQQMRNAEPPLTQRGPAIARSWATGRATTDTCPVMMIAEGVQGVAKGVGDEWWRGAGTSATATLSHCGSCTWACNVDVSSCLGPNGTPHEWPAAVAWQRLHQRHCPRVRARQYICRHARIKTPWSQRCQHMGIVSGDVAGDVDRCEQGWNELTSGLVISREQGLRYDAGFAAPVLMS